jgi:hypothetical protein
VQSDAHSTLSVPDPSSNKQQISPPQSACSSHVTGMSAPHAPFEHDPFCEPSMQQVSPAPMSQVTPPQSTVGPTGPVLDDDMAVVEAMVVEATVVGPVVFVVVGPEVELPVVVCPGPVVVGPGPPVVEVDVVGGAPPAPKSN